jgi:8-oxo-dGTP diphosphatase
MGRLIHQNISVDCVIFGFDSLELKVLLVERELHDEETGELIFKDKTLTGNHIYLHEELESAARRILDDLTGIEEIYLEQFFTFGSPSRVSSEKDRLWIKAQGRNPDEHIVTVGYFSLLDINKVEVTYKDRNVAWYPVNNVGELGFDHNEILRKALSVLRDKLLKEPLAYELLPDKFTLTQMQCLYEAIMGVEYDKRNFRKKVAKMKYLVPLDEKVVGNAHRPPRLYFFSRDVYEITRKQLFDFSV